MEVFVMLGFFVTLAILGALGLTADSRTYTGFYNPSDSPPQRPWVD